MKQLSWQHQVNMFKSHQARIASSATRSNEDETIKSSFFLFACQVQGIGTNIDTPTACEEHLLRAARAGDPCAQAIFYRATIALYKSSLSPTLLMDTAQWLRDSVAKGCFGAKDDFQHLLSSQTSNDTFRLLKSWYGAAANSLRSNLAGVGARHFLDGRGARLNPLSINDPKTFEAAIARHARDNKFDINVLAINSRGDRLLHFLSACGFGNAIGVLGRYFGERLDINTVNEYGETPLLSASRAGQKENTRILLEREADLRPSNSGENPLHWLSMFDVDGIRELTQLICKKPCAINPEVKHAGIRTLRINQTASSCKWGIYWDSEFPHGTPLHQAVFSKNLEVVKILLDLGADPLKPESGVGGPCALELACHNYQWAILLAMSDKLNIRMDDLPVPSLLHLAIFSYDELSSLLRNGVDYKMNLIRTLALLVDRGASPALVPIRIPGSDAKSTALFEAVLSKSELLVELALSKKLLTDHSFLNAKCEEQLLTALHMAVQQGSLIMVEKLIHAGADPTIPAGSDYLTSTLHLCANIDSSSPHQLEILNRILPFFVNVDQSHEGGETPFVKAVRLLKFDIATALLDKGANVDFKFSNAEDDVVVGESITILGFLVGQMNPASVAAVQFLLGYDRDGRKKPNWKHRLPSLVVNTRFGMTVFHTVASRRQNLLYALDIVKEMMSYVSETYGHKLEIVNQACVAGTRPTALHIAARDSNIEIVASLLRLGANREAADDEYFTPAEIAAIAMTKNLEVDESRGWTEAACRREMERRKGVYEMLGGSMDIFKTTEVDDLALIDL